MFLYNKSFPITNTYHSIGWFVWLGIWRRLQCIWTTWCRWHLLRLWVTNNTWMTMYCSNGYHLECWWYIFTETTTNFFNWNWNYAVWEMKRRYLELSLNILLAYLPIIVKKYKQVQYLPLHLHLIRNFIAKLCIETSN